MWLVFGGPGPDFEESTARNFSLAKLCSLVELGFSARALCVPGKRSASELCPQPSKGQSQRFSEFSRSGHNVICFLVALVLVQGN